MYGTLTLINLTIINWLGHEAIRFNMNTNKKSWPNSFESSQRDQALMRNEND